jgi:hypothetical protein
MGQSLSWIGVQTMTAAELYTKLGLAETGERGDYLQFAMSGQELPNHWYLLVAKRCDHLILSDGLSAECSIVACSIEEHVAYMSTSFWRNRREIWNVHHRGGDHGVMDLVVRGSLPAAFDDLRARAFARQAAAGGQDAGVDYVAGIPQDLARSIVGFQYDEINPGIDNAGFRALRQEATGPLADARRGWWKFWQR